MRSRKTRVAAFSLSVAVTVIFAAPAHAVNVGVTTTADNATNDGECSLREAVTATNNNAAVNGADDCAHNGSAGPDTITLASGTYTTAGAANEDSNTTGDFDIVAGNGLTLDGNGSGATTLDGNADRLLDVRSGTATVKDLTITDGNAGVGHGGGIRAGAGGVADLTVEFTTVTQSQSDLGGGIRVLPGSELTLNGSTVSLNESTGTQGGGGIHSGGNVAIADSQINVNEASNTMSGGGGGMRFEGDLAVIENSNISGNTAVNGEGGGIEVTSGSSERVLRITDSAFISNSANDRSGGAIDVANDTRLTIDRSLFSLNTANFAGGAVANDGTMVMRRSAVSTNSISSTVVEAIRGGGISNTGVARISNSIIANNKVLSPNEMAIRAGGGISNTNGTSLAISSSLISGNEVAAGGDASGFGGGINTEQPLELTNTTITGNDSGAGSGGGLFQANGTGQATLSHVTLTDNTAASNPQVRQGTGSSVNVHATVIAGGPGACQAGTTLTSTGYNVDEGSSCGLSAPSDSEGVAAGLTTLADLGGIEAGLPSLESAIPIHGLAKTSPAVDRVPLAECVSATGKKLSTDARGVPRPGGANCDSGSYERVRCMGKLAGAETIVGTNAANVISGTAQADIIFGLRGNDTIRGRKADDRICAGIGNDELIGGPGTDRCDGGQGNDTAVCEVRRLVP